MAYVAKIRNGRCELYDPETRAFKGSVGVGRRCVSAAVQGDLVAVTLDDGSVKLYDCRTRAFKGSV